MNRRVPYLVVAAILLSTLAGCVQQKTDGATHTFTYELWVPLCTILGGIVAAPVGWFASYLSDRLGGALMIFGPLGALFFGPTLFLERAVVDDSAFTVRTGVWGSTHVNVKYEDLTQVRYNYEEVRGRRGRKSKNHYLLCDRKDGSMEKIPLASQVVQDAALPFVQKITERNIPYAD